MRTIKIRITLVGIILTVMLFALMGMLCISRDRPKAYAESADIYSQYIFDPINNGQEYSIRAADRKSITIANIPHIYNGKKVTEIANNGFSMCTNLSQVSIPDSITRIGNNAFFNCINLVRVFTFENSNDRSMIIGTNAFYNCSNVKMQDLVLPKVVEEVESGAFKNVKATLQVRLSKAEADEKYADDWVDESITPVVYGSTYTATDVKYELTRDGNSYYVPTQGFTSENINSSMPEVIIRQEYNGLPVEYIDEFAFMNNMIQKLVIEESLNGHKIKIYNNAFYYAHIKEINCGDSVEFIDKNGNESNSVFGFSEGLEKVTLPHELNSIGESMFEACSDLKCVNFGGTEYINSIPDNISNFAIHKDAFKDCRNLGTLVNNKKEFFIPRNVTNVEENAFSGWCADQRISSSHKIRPNTWSGVWYGSNVSAEIVWADVVVEFYNHLGKFLYSFSGPWGTTFMVPMNPDIPGYVSRWSDGYVAKRREFFEDDTKIFLEPEREKTLDECRVNNIYFIYTANQLNSVRNYASSTYTFSLSADIQLDPTIPWIPIPNFKGTFNGNGYTISGLYISATEAGNYGLFAINSGSIGKLNVKGNIVVSSGSGMVHAGLIAGQNDNYINYCYSYADGHANINYNGSNYSTAIKSERVESVVGGLVGYNAKHIFNSTNYGNVYSRGHVGGVVGYNYNTVSNVVNEGYVLYSYGGVNKSIGGVIGINNGGVQNNCTNKGDIYYENRSSIKNPLFVPAIGTIVGCNTYRGDEYWLRGYQVYNYGKIYGTGNLTSEQTIYIGGEVGKTLTSETDTGL